MFLSKCSIIEDKLYEQYIDYYGKKRYIERETDPKKILEGQMNRLPLYKKESLPFPNMNKWRDDYYKYYEGKLDTCDINEMCNSWVNMINWNFDYYFNGCRDYHYYYPYNCSPTLIDIVRFLKNKDVTIEICDNPPLNTDEQLSLILPLTSHNFINIKYRELIYNELCDFYPTNFKVLMWGKTYYHECIPILPKLDLDRYKSLWQKMENKKQNNGSFIIL